MARLDQNTNCQINIFPRSKTVENLVRSSYHSFLHVTRKNIDLLAVRFGSSVGPGAVSPDLPDGSSLVKAVQPSCNGYI